MSATTPREEQLREAYLPDRRVRLASDVATVCAALLWAAGLITLVVKVSGLDSSYTIEAGTYVSAGLILVGLVSTLAMWPGDLPVVKVNRKGTVREPTAAAAPR